MTESAASAPPCQPRHAQIGSNGSRGSGVTLGEPASAHGHPPRSLIRRGFVVGDGYGGIEPPDFELPCDDAVYLVPCFRGLSLSSRPPISSTRKVRWKTGSCYRS